MMSLEAILALNAQIAIDACIRNSWPYVPSHPIEVNYWPPIPFPVLGNYVPDSWEQTEQSWFVDKTGCGEEWEPALTVEQFKMELRAYIAANPGHGFAITEEGEFQVYVAAFRRVDTEGEDR